MLTAVVDVTYKTRTLVGYETQHALTVRPSLPVAMDRGVAMKPACSDGFLCLGREDGQACLDCAQVPRCVKMTLLKLIKGNLLCFVG